MHATIAEAHVAGTNDGPIGVVILGVEPPGPGSPVSTGVDGTVTIDRGVARPGPDAERTHDLLDGPVEALGGRLDRVHIAADGEGLFGGTVHLATPHSGAVVAAHSSDSLPLAPRRPAPMDIADQRAEPERRPGADVEDRQDSHALREGP